MKTQSKETLTYFSAFGAFAALAKAFAGNEFGQKPRGCGLNSMGSNLHLGGPLFARYRTGHKYHDCALDTCATTSGRGI